MFNKSSVKKIKPNTFDYCQQMFDEKETEIQDNIDFNSAKKLYEDIKKYYIERIKQDESFISVEKIRLQQELGKYTRDFVNTNINLYIAFMSAFGALLLQDIGFFNRIKITFFSQEINSFLSMLLKILVYLIFLLGITYQMNFDKSSRHQKRETILNNIKLRVVEDLEKEMNKVSEKINAKAEVAATIQHEEHSREQEKHISHQANGNWNVEINMPSIIDAIVGTYKAGKFIRKMFRKRK